MNNFRVTSGNDGVRSFGEYSRGNYRGNRGNRNNNYRGNNWKRKQGYNRFSKLNPNMTDDDVSMNNETDTPNRHVPYGRNRNRGNNRGPYDINVSKRLGLPVGSGNRRSNRYHKRDSVPMSSSSYFKIVIPHGKKYEKRFILQSLTNQTSVPFVPLQFHYEKVSAVFYVDNKPASDALRSLSGKITTPNGFKMNIFTQPTQHLHSSPLTGEVIEKLKVAMSDRYDPQSKSLNMSAVYNDSALNKDGIYLCLYKQNAMESILNIIKENIPDVETLDLSGNSLNTLDVLSNLSKTAPNVSRLNLSKNSLKSEDSLNQIQNLKLTELWLEGNPMCDHFTAQNKYISFLRKKFPALVTLDGHDLPPPIKFDLDSPSQLPQHQHSCFPNDNVKSLITNFLEQYLNIYDSKDRQKLYEAYHETAVFSFMTLYNKLVPNRQSHFGLYLSDARNLLKQKDTNKRQKNLRVGPINIVAMLNQLPNTQHDLHSLTVDVNFLSDKVLNFTVSGIFKEVTSEKVIPIRAFTRNFSAVPSGSGILLTNDQLVITNATESQIKNAFKIPAPTPSSSPIPQVATVSPLVPIGPSPIASPLNTASPVAGISGSSASSPVLPALSPPSSTLLASAPSDEIKQAMVTQFSQQSNMNRDWSLKCLVQNEWDFDKAAVVFTKLKSQNKIPAEAFMK